ncbi:Putative peptidase S53, activation domain, peptidase S8, subtilisin, Ser-active, Sedolisin [Colletotrichum destructivum]|uniref:tripeptidyl-peptidase II n=1 Tax=Colletotrichum destructivum TaxID=34406 RepID=A0AAX4IGU6_9PEZI|nr:Putative peptidase S53, activation domain, peptidase S8, subtilisin, Ser-active, Sedolisin [Colletotrichum destructivum]
MSRHATSSLMMLLFLCVLFATLVRGFPRSQISQQQQSQRIRDSIRSPLGWKRTTRAETDTVVHLQIGLKHDGFKELERRLYELSSPSHRSYGHHLSGSDVAQLLKPSAETVRKAEDWLIEHGITRYDMTPGRDWIRASVPVRTAETLLDAEFYHFESDSDGDVLVRTLEWSLPEHLRGHIDVVQPTNSFLRSVPQDRHGGIPRPAWEVEGRVPTYEELVEEDLVERGHLDIPALADLPPKPTVADACNRLAVSSLCLRVLYGTLDYEVQQPVDANATNKVGVVNFLGHNNNRSDIAQYLELYRPDAAAAGAATSFETVLVAGAVDQQTPNTPEQMSRAMGLEGALDVETLLGVAHPVPVVAWNVGGRPPFQPSSNKAQNSNEPYLEWLHHLAALDDAALPRVVSVSYADEEQTVPPRYAARVCEAFAQLGARGVSVIVASGDEGVGKEGKCVSNDGADTPRFMPAFPASCPYVTAVGGTRHFDPVMAGFDARGGFSTGGGFSNYFPRPRYQEPAVAAYVAGLNTTHGDLYNPQGRGIPDVAAMAYHFPVVWNGTSHLLDGTSASAPTFAAVIALINDALLAEGRPSLGFLNPWLYSSALPGLRDVTIGSNRGCGTMGFPAVEGWDAATGLGTPWFPVLKHLALRDAFRWDHPWYVADLA